MADLDSLLSSAQGGQLIANLAGGFGFSRKEMKDSVEGVAADISYGREQTVEKPEGLGKVVECLCAAHECSAHDHHDAAHAPDAIDRGQTAVLSLFGSQDNASPRADQALPLRAPRSLKPRHRPLKAIRRPLATGMSKTLGRSCPHFNEERI